MNLFGRLSYWLTFSTLSFSPLWLSGQVAITWTLDPHAGIYSSFLQPAATTTTPYDWELNLVSTSGLLANNYVFARRASGVSLLQALREGAAVTVDERTNSFSLGGRDFSYGFPDGNRKLFVRGGVDLLGPALSFRLGETTRVGLFSRVRALTSSRSIDADLNYLPYNATPNGVDIAIDAIQAAGAVWGEAGLHVAHAVVLHADAELSLGGNFRYLLPAEGFNAYQPDGGSLRQLPGDSLITINVQAEVELTNGLLAGTDGPTGNGRGFAADLGLQYAWESLAAGIYRYSLGVSLLDLGQLNFAAANRYRFSNSGDVLLVGEDYNFSGDDGLEAALNQLEQDINGSSAATRVSESFVVGLPTSVSLQFRYRPLAAVQLAAAYRGDLSAGNRQLSQGQVLTLAAHYSKWWYGGGLSASITEWQQFQLGAQVRLGPLYAGTDRLLGTVLPRTTLSEGDFFLGIRLHDFGGEGGRQRNTRRGRSRRGNKVKCYTF